MSQEINLYEARLRPQRTLVSARHLAIAAGVVCALMLSLSFYARFDAQRKAGELAAVQAELAAEQSRLTALAKSLGERSVAPALAAELQQTQAQIDVRAAAMRVLESGRLGNRQGFSGFMRGFARQASSELWLTGFALGAGGDEIEIRGALLDPARLPAYVARLGSESVFHGRKFATLTMRNVAGEPAQPGATTVQPRYVEFVLRSDSAAGGKSGEDGAVPPAAKGAER